MTGDPRARSCLYVGRVRHRRRGPVAHEFSMPLFMVYVDLAELGTVFRRRLLWSASGPNVAWFRRADYLGDAAVPLDEAVRRRVEQETGWRPAGPIRLLTHLRYLGHCFNPVSFYYCFDKGGERVEAVVAEITNTPWKERHAYVLPAASAERAGGRGEVLRYRFAKAFHVSPFMPMEIEYDWSLGLPGEDLLVQMNLARGGREGAGVKMFDATLTMTRREMTGGQMARVLALYPAQTLRVVARIHWEALRLWLKRCPVYPRPRGGAGEEAHT